MEDKRVPDVAHVIRLSLEDIDWTSGHFSPSPAAALLKESCFQSDLASNANELILFSMQQQLTAIVKIGLLSFSGSHVCRSDLNLWGPVWVLGVSGARLEQKRLKLSMLVQDIQEIWGPAWLVGQPPKEGKVIRTERGYIVPLQSEKKGKGKEKAYSLPIDVECHWSNILEAPCQIEEPVLLSNTSRILISTNTDCVAGLVFNSRCQSSIQRFQKQVANDHTIPGACEEFFSFEDREFQVGFQSQHGPVANVTWLHKRYPMKSMKETIRSGSTSKTIDYRKFLGILKLRIGLEISACTGNAQKITLWDALRLSRTDRGLPPNLKCKHAVGDLVCIQSCWTQLAKPRFLNSKPTTDVSAVWSFLEEERREYARSLRRTLILSPDKRVYAVKACHGLTCDLSPDFYGLLRVLPLFHFCLRFKSAAWRHFSGMEDVTCAGEELERGGGSFSCEYEYQYTELDESSGNS
ncbi:hypothetical protein N7478_003636 [Penicillium angulare]|uniref:uncharacterized protein n=1 Tax=Penicillium angulare TaxID=116970 RepID=UPI00254102A8|nr:uncharacterized protein N7478_003636 [Penicillium angulare]KAJ5287950.1 hypothetical protein N7478_003636 [Penicillium angulare]